MKAIILAAGYATRLYPLTLTQPKPLLPVAGKPMIDHVLKSISPIRGLDRVYVVTNARFAGHFESWASRHASAHDAPALTIINDGTTDDTNKLGAIGDMALVLERGCIEDDLLVVAGDNLFSETLGGFGDYCRKVQAPVLGIYDVGNLEEIKKYNSISVDAEGRITFFEEKPKLPRSTMTGIALYYYPRKELSLIKRYLAEGNNRDQPGRLVQWMYPQVPFYTWVVPGVWYDIGSKEALAEADRVFSAQPG